MCVMEYYLLICVCKLVVNLYTQGSFGSYSGTFVILRDR
jgi:hypothetical protein